MNGPLSEKALKFSHEAMGTIFELLVTGVDSAYAAQAASAVFNEIDRLEHLLSRFDPGSDIGRLNRIKPGDELYITAETHEILSVCEQMKTATNGAFDVGFNCEASPGRSLFSGEDGDCAAAGVDPSGPGPDSQSRRESFRLIQTKLGFSASLNPGFSGNTRIDPGGIGKGFALDKCRILLRDWDLERTLFHAGTSTAAASGDSPVSKPHKWGWPVGIAGPWRGTGIPGSIVLRDRAVSGSGTEIKGAHIIDPRTGYPAKNHLAAWASHPEAAVADALSTAFMVMSTEEIDEFCSSRPEVWALVIRPDESYVEFNSSIRKTDQKSL